MPTQTMISVKMDKSLKIAAQKTAAEFGLPLGTMINAFLKQIVREKKLTLSLSLSPTPYLKHIISEGDAELRKSKKLAPKSYDEMFRSLNT